jgi:hypothetical protein
VGGYPSRSHGHVGEHSIAIGRLERALASYVGHAVGAGSATESLVAGLLKFSVGTLETVGVLAGLAAVVGLYELMTSSSREAKKQMDDMTDSLVNQAKPQKRQQLRGKENLELIAQANRQAVQKGIRRRLPKCRHVPSYGQANARCDGRAEPVDARGPGRQRRPAGREGLHRRVGQG